MEENGQRINTSRIVHNQYIYHRDKRSDGRRFVCGSRSTLLRCNAKLIQNGNDFTMISQNNHPPPTLRKHCISNVFINAEITWNQIDGRMNLNRDRRVNQARDDRHIREIQNVLDERRFNMEEFLRASIPIHRREIILFEINIPQYENDNGELIDEVHLQDLLDPAGIPDENVEELGQRSQLKPRLIAARRRRQQPVVIIPARIIIENENEDVAIDDPAEIMQEEIEEELPPMYGPYRIDVNEIDEPEPIIGQNDQDVNIEAEPPVRFVDEVAGDGEARCVACLQNKAKVFTVPCSHLCLRHQCLALYKNANERDDDIWFCPVCRGQSQFIQIPALFH
ncbi:hypothetical protein PV327_005156 [Microctonus hyperodae]|uniref:RING-type domain-containing protein n=1 Tax=Microctonus hyperodae TaxID=165561 RepID=A0AA39G0T1_MICHY|nr:hypothetical protein PV327_005156 [Microctonus hyperodae]